jgi:hypothetical protein
MALSFLAFAPRAGAEERALALRYEAPDGCPARAAFETLVLARTRRVRFDDTSARHASVAIAFEDDRYVGALEIEAREGARDGARRARRTVEAPTCSQLAEAVALVAALAIDPEATTEPIPTPPPAPDPPPDPTFAPAIAPKPAPPPAAADSTAPRSSAARSPPARSRWAIGGGLRFDGIGAPDPIVAIAGRGEYQIVTSSLFSPSFGAEVAAGTSDLLGHGRGVDVSFALVRLDACPAKIAIAVTGVALRACGGAALGLFRAVGVGVSTPETALRPWLDAEARLRTRWERSHWFVGFDVGPTFPITRPTFVFLQPRRVVYQTPAIGLAAAFTLGMQI